MNAKPAYHESVLVKEVLETLDPRPGQLILDLNLGHAGHTLQILSRMGQEGLVVGVDVDPSMLATAQSRLAAADVDRSRFRLVEADFLDLEKVLALVPVPAAAPAPAPAPVQVPAPDAILFDFGPSTPQLLDLSRGMSWESESSLDMRMQQAGSGPTAEQIVNDWSEEDLSRLFFLHADERWSARIAKRIVERRKAEPIRSGRDLGRIVSEAIPRGAWPPKTHPATRVFLALRIEVNQEYRKIEQVLPLAFRLLKPGGKLAAITFHSGEDRRVKEFMREATQPPPVPWPLPQGAGAPPPARLLTRKPLTPGDEELAANPRSRSAKLRAIQKREA